SSAATAAQWTREHIGADALEFLRGLSPQLDGRALGLYHASPRDPVWEYVLSTWQADECMDLMEPRVAAVGHSHVALFFQGCGADEETKPSIPAAASGEFLKRLRSVEARFNVGGGACRDIPEDQRLVNDQIARLPSSVDSDVRNALQDSFDHLFDLTDEQCD